MFVNHLCIFQYFDTSHFLFIKTAILCYQSVKIHLPFIVSVILIYLVDMEVTFVFLNLQNHSL